uniref:alpha/beta hydrolase fold domain-containing protein n=1 Tax=uncultured Sphingomonas sp. TaxID=158754 RepID=UPI0035CA2AEA
MSADPVNGVLVEARVIPFPASISAHARGFMASLVGADGVPLMVGQAPPAADDAAGWAAAKAMTAAMIAQFMAPALAASTSTVETVELGGAVVHVATPRDPGPDDRAYIDLHGGGLVHGGGEPCRIGALLAADRHRVRSYAVDYRMPPEHPYPAALEDCLAVYRALLERYAPENIIVGGGSAGSNLAAALALRARDEGLPLPAALVLLTPELDLTESGDTFETNRRIDVILTGPLMSTNLLYAAGHDLADPYLSPLFGDFTKGFPPTFLQAGTRDLFLSNAARMHRSLRRAGVSVELHVFEGMPHGGFAGAPEDLEMHAEVNRFVAEHWGKARQAIA